MNDVSQHSNIVRALATEQLSNRPEPSKAPPPDPKPTCHDSTNLWAWKQLPEWQLKPDKERIPGEIRSAMNIVLGDVGKYPLVILGQSGAGKTCAALLFLDHSWQFCCYTTEANWADMHRKALLGELRSSSGFPRTCDELWSAWNRACCCVLDDVGTREKASDHRYEVLLNSINRRKGRPLVIVSNAPTLRGIAELYDERIASRLNGGTVVTVAGDQRKGTRVE